MPEFLCIFVRLGPAGIVRYSPYLSVHLSAVCFFSITVFIWHSCYKIPFEIALRSIKEAYKPPDNSENSFSAVTASLNSSKHKRTPARTYSLASNAAQTAWQVDAMSLICIRHAQGVGVYLGAPPPSARAAVIIFNSLFCQAVHWWTLWMRLHSCFIRWSKLSKYSQELRYEVQLLCGTLYLCFFVYNTLCRHSIVITKTLNFDILSLLLKKKNIKIKLH